MTRLSRIHRLLAPVFERNPDVVNAGGFLVLQPIRHVYRGIILDRTSRKGVFYPRWALSAMCIVDAVPTLGGYICEEKLHAVGFYDLPEDGISKILSDEMDAETIPFLRSMSPIEEYYHYAMHRDRPISIWARAHFKLEIAMGHFDVARALMDQHRHWWFKDQPHWNAEERAGFRRTRELCNLLETNSFGEIASVLREWEATTAKNFKVDHIWQPSPFPFEDG